MKYIVNGFKDFENIDDVIDYIVENIDDEIFDEMLDETHGEIEILGSYYNPSYILYKLDPIMYNCAKSDYYDSLRDDIKYWLENEEDCIYGFDIEYVENEE